MARSLPIRLRTITAAVVVVATGLIIWNAYQSIINSTDPMSQTLPIIKADTEPFRVLPDDPGGAEIPNQGSRLFNVLNAENADELALSGVRIDREGESADTIMPTGESTGFELPEVPEPQRESLFGEIEDLKDRQVIEEDPELEVIAEDDRRDLSEKLASVIVQKQTEKKEEKPVSEKPKKEDTENTSVDIKAFVPLKKPSVPSQSTAVAKASPKQQGFDVDAILKKDKVTERYYIQLASLRSEADARATYARIRDSFPKLVQGVSVVFPKADLGDRGTFYRIQIGPLTEKDAQLRCQDYSTAARGGTCLVLSR